MMRYLLVLSLSIPLAISAQFNYQEVNTTPNKVDETYQKSAPETILPRSLAESDCDSIVTVFEFNNGDLTGFVTGTNSLIEDAKIQRFIYESDTPYSINEIGVAFAVVEDNIGDQTVAVRIYNDINADSTLGSLIATSDSVLVSDLLLPDADGIQFSSFTFPEPPVLERDSFWVYLDFSDVYQAPEGNLAVYSTQDSCGSGTNTFAVFPGQDTNVTVTFEARYGLNIEMLILAVVDPDIQVSTPRQSLADYTTTLAPNPTSNRLTLSYQSPGAENFTATITDLAGRTLLKSRASATSGTNTFDWDLSALPAGLYLYHLDGPQGRQSGKVTKL